MHIDIEYAGKIGIRLDQYKVTRQSPFRANFRCPLCGDSEKSKTKKRGWMLGRDDGSVHYYCHNCFFSRPLPVFLEHFDKALYDSYLKDKLMKKRKSKDLVEALKKKDEPEDYKDYSSHLKKLKRISSLSHNHPAKKYIDKRRIPPANHYKLYYTDDFNGWVNSIIPDKLPSNIKEARIVFPFFDEQKRMFGLCGRSLRQDSKLRYISIMLDDKQNKFFGLESVDFDRRYYIFEGAIDSLFIGNSIAAAGADSKVSSLKNVEKSVQVFDNEPHNKEIVKRMAREIKRGHPICIWPDHIETGTDLNDLILKGYEPTKLKKIIDDNVYSGMYADLRLSEWRKA